MPKTDPFCADKQQPYASLEGLINVTVLRAVFYISIKRDVFDAMEQNVWYL